MTRFSEIAGMRRWTLAAAACALVLASLADAAAAQDDLQTIQLLFVQSTPGGNFDGERLHLEHVGHPLNQLVERERRICQNQLPRLHFGYVQNFIDQF